MQCDFLLDLHFISLPLSEVSRVCSTIDLTYCCIQQSDKKIQLVMVHLGITQSTADDSSEDNKVMGTEEILAELSEV